MFRRDFSSEHTCEKNKMCSLFLASGADADGSYSYSGPLRGLDEVLASLQLLAFCGIECSFLDAVQCGIMCKVTADLCMDGILHANAPPLEDGPWQGGCSGRRFLQCEGENVPLARPVTRG